VLRHRAAKHSSEVYDRETNKKLEFITQLTLEYLYVSLKKKELSLTYSETKEVS
jgi:hypothetical protein